MVERGDAVLIGGVNDKKVIRSDLSIVRMLSEVGAGEEKKRIPTEQVVQSSIKVEEYRRVNFSIGREIYPLYIHSSLSEQAAFTQLLSSYADSLSMSETNKKILLLEDEKEKLKAAVRRLSNVLHFLGINREKISRIVSDETFDTTFEQLIA